jgi:hypothetical protein
MLALQAVFPDNISRGGIPLMHCEDVNIMSNVGVAVRFSEHVKMLKECRLCKGANVGDSGRLPGHTSRGAFL